jgi:S1-C subfamily serine protease
MAETKESSATLAALSNNLADVVERADRSVVAIHARSRIPSSGVLWRKGVVVTADHTIKRDEDISITLHDGSRVPATIAGRDATTDIAVLKLDTGESAVPATLGDASRLRAGHLVLVVGRPGDDVTASLGLVSIVGGEWRTWRAGKIDHYILLDVAIHDGFSGSPLVDTSGNVVGINTSGLARARAMTIPTSTVNRVVDALLTKGRIARGYLGLAMQPVRLAEDLAKSVGMADTLGLIIVNVEPGGPGADGGALLGDVVVSANGHAVRDPRDLLAALGPDSIGRPLKLRVIRAGAPRDLDIKVRERSAR